MKFRDFIDVRDGTHDSPKSISEIGYPLVTTKRLGNGFIDFSNTNNISEEDYIAINKRSKVDQFDILISMIGTVGSVYQERHSEPGYAIKNVGLLKFNGNETFSNYVYYWLKSANGQNEIKARLKGTTQQFLSLTELRNLTIELPSRDEMNLAVAPLMLLDQKMYTLGSINDNLLELGSTLWDKYFQFANADKQQSRLTDLADIVAGGTPSKKNESFYDGGTIPWITPKDLSNASGTVFINHGDVSITEAGLSGSSAKLMPAGSVLFSSRAPIGYVAIANNPVTTNQGFKSLVPHDDSETYYLYYLLKKLTPHIESVAGGSTFKEISGSGMKSIEFPKPDDMSMSEFATLVQPMFNLIRENEEEIQRLIELRDVLLSNLLG